tara:strand:- start:614 stop:976 length:363 start_codon:yes stop_codon:yes gene_type:complete
LIQPNSKYKKHIFICVNERNPDSSRGDCTQCGGQEIRLEFVRLINQYGLKGKVRANKSGCLDTCELGPTVVIYPGGIWYNQISLSDVEEIFKTSVLGNDAVKRLRSTNKTWEQLTELRNQ